MKTDIKFREMWSLTVFTSLLVVLLFDSVYASKFNAADQVGDVCKALHALEKSPAHRQRFWVPDGMQGIDISSANALKWLSPSSCAEGSLSVDYASDWVNSPEIGFQDDVSGIATCKGGRNRTVIKATYDKDKDVLDVETARIEFEFDVVRSGDKEAHVTGYVGFSVSKLPGALLGRYVPLWTGNLSTVSDAAYTLVDSDLFDGAAVTLVDGSSHATEESITKLQKIVRLAASVNPRFVGFDPIPSCLEGDVTARLGLPQETLLTESGVISTSNAYKDTNTVVFTAARTCKTASECGDTMVATLAEFATSQNVCNSPEVIDETVFGSLSASVVMNLTADLHVVKGVRAAAQAVFRCADDSGYVSVTLDATQEKPDEKNLVWEPTDIFMNDNIAAITMTGASSVLVAGTRCGIVSDKDNSIKSTLEGDMFAEGRNGVFLNDASITKDDRDNFLSAVKSVSDLLKTQLPSLDAAIAEAVGANSAEEVFDAYLASTSFPTSHGLWFWWANGIDGIEIVSDDSPDHSGLVARIELFLRNVELDLQDTSVLTKSNEVLQKLKTQIGSAAGNFTVYSLDNKNTTVKSSIVDGAVTTTVNIPQLKSFRNIGLAASKQFAMKAIIHASWDETKVQNPLVTSACIICYNDGTNEEKAYLEQATLNKGISGFPSPVAWDTDDNLVTNTAWDSSSIQKVADNFGAAAEEVKKEEERSAEQLRVVSEVVSTKFSELVQKVSSALKEGNATGTVDGVMKRVSDSALKAIDPHNIGNVLLLLRLRASSKDASLGFDLSAFSVRHFTAEATGGEWRHTVPLERTHVATPLWAHLVVSATKDKSGSVDTFTQKGKNSLSGWTLPIRSGMRSGYVTGLSQTDINFPESATITMTMNGTLEHGGSVGASLSANMTVAPSQADFLRHIVNGGKKDEDPDLHAYTWNFEEADRGDYAQSVDPLTAMGSYTDYFHFLDAMETFQLDQPVSPFAQPLSQFAPFKNVWDEPMTWAYTYNPQPILAAVFFSEFPYPASEDDFNFTINGEVVSSCHLSFPDITGENAEEEFNKLLKGCGEIGSLVQAVFVVSEETTNEITSGTIQLIPTYSGSVRNFGIDTSNETKAPLHTRSWSIASTEPSSLSWNDMYKVVYWGMIQPAGLPYTAPVRRSLSVSQYRLVDPSRAQFYPDTFDGVFFPIYLGYSTTADVKLNGTMTSGTDEVNMTLDDSSSARVKVDASLVGVYGMSLWCSTGNGTLSLSTSFTNSTVSNTTVVPDEPDNVFTLTSSFEIRHSGSSRNNEVPQLRLVSEVISLTPGELVADELARVPSLVKDQDLAKMLVTSRDSDNIRYIYRGLYREPTPLDEIGQQVVLSTNPYVSDDQSTLLFPLHLEISHSGIPYWGNSDTSTAVRALTNCPLTANLNASISVVTDDEVNDATPYSCNGNTGLIEATAAATVHVVQSFNLTERIDLDFTPSLYTSLVSKENLSNCFVSTASLNTVADVTNFDFQDVTVAATGIKDETIRFVKDTTSSFEELAQKALELYNTMVPANSTFAEALKSLIKSAPKHVCEILDLADEALDLFSNNSLVSGTLPLVSEALSPAFEEKISSAIKKIKETICDDSGQLSIKPLCKTLSEKWGVQACADIELTEKRLTLYIEAIPRPFKYDASFRFDTSRIFPALKDVDIGFGAGADFEFIATLGASFGLDFEFVSGDKNESSSSSGYLPSSSAPVPSSSVPVPSSSAGSGSEVMVEDEVGKFPGIRVSLNPQHTFFTAYASVNASTDLKVSFGSIVIAFGSARVLLDGRGGANITEDHKLDVYLDGSADFTAQASLEPILSCAIEAQIPSIANFITKKGNVTFTDSCKEGKFIELLQLLLEDQTFAKYFSDDPSLFWKQFVAALEDGLFRDLVNKLLNVGVSFLGKQIQGLVRKALDAIDGPEIADLVGKQIADMVANIILNHTLPNRTDLEQIVIEVFTGILNQRLAPVLREPIPVPQAGSERLAWKMRLGTTTTKVLSNIDFHLGGHGQAQFGVVCQPELQLLWDVKFDLVWTKSKGISIEWPEDFAFGGEVKLETQQCSLEGRLLFLGAYFQPDIKVDGAIRVLPNYNETTKLRALEFKVDASITGEGELGLVGILGNITDSVKDSLPALPHVKANFDIYWGIDLTTDHSGKTTPSHFKLNEPQLCLGTFITKFMRGITDQVYKVIKPLEPIFGEDGILMKKIDALQPFLGDKNDLLGIIELMCQYFADSCNLDGVRTLIKLLQGIAKTIKTIEEIDSWLNSGDEGCASIKMIYEAFHINFTRSDPQPEYDNQVYDPVSGRPLHDFGDGNITFDENWGDDDQRGVVRDTISGWKVEGKFAFVVDILHDLPVKLISILLGKDEPLVSFHFPTATFSFLVHWSIPVYPFPYVEIVIAAQAGVQFSPPPIALMSSAVVEMIRTHNPSYLFRNLAIQTLQDNGDPYWVITGFVQLGGGAAVGVSVYVLKVIGEATIDIRFTASIAPFSVNGDQWTTFDAIAMQVYKHGIEHSVALKLKFDAGFSIALKGCLLSWCVTIVHFSWQFTIWEKEFIPDKLPAIATPDGVVDGDVMNYDVDPDEFVYINTLSGDVNDMLFGDVSQYTNFTVTPESVMLIPRGKPIGQFGMTRPLNDGLKELRFTGDFCKNPVNVHLNGDISFPINLPDCANSIANISQGAYENAEDFHLARNSVSAGANPAITFTGAWQYVVLSEPLYGTAYYASGMPPCPVVIDTDELSNLQITGQPSDFASQPLYISGLLHDATCTATCNKYVVDQDSMNCVDTTSSSPDDSVNVTFPTAMVSLTASTDTVMSEFTILGTRLGREVSLTSRSGSSRFIIPELRNINGLTDLSGNCEGNNDLNLMLSALPDTPLEVVVTSTDIKMSEENDVHTVHLSNVNYRNISVVAASAGTARVTVLEVDDFTMLSINSVAQGGSTTVHEIASCSTLAKVVLNLHGEGTHEVRIPDPTSTHCSLSIISNMNGDDSTSTLLLNGTEDQRSLSWTISGGHIIARTLYGSEATDVLSIDYQNLNHMQTILGPSRNEVQADFTGDAGEFVLDLSANSNGNASVNIVGAERAVYLRGMVDLAIVGTTHAFDAFHGPIALSGNANVAVTVQSSEAQQNFKLSKNCLSENSSAIQHEASQWMQGLMAADGLKYSPSCNILLNPSADVKQTLNVKTGSGADSFIATESNIDVTVDLGDGDNTLSWFDSNDVSLKATLGKGADKISLGNTGNVVVDLGDDSSVDIFDIIYSGQSPSIKSNVITPTGPYETSSVKVLHWKQEDAAEIKRSEAKTTITPTDATINFTVTSSILKYDMDDQSRYFITDSASGSMINMIGFSDSYTATNSSVYVSMANLKRRCNIVVASKSKASTAVGFVLPENAVIPDSITVESGNHGQSGSIMIDSVTLGMDDIDHVELTLPEDSQTSGTVTINGVPCNADILVSLPDAAWKVDLVKADSNVAVFDGEMTLTKQLLQSSTAMVVAGRSTPSSAGVSVKSGGNKLRLIDGCMSLADASSHSILPISDWMVNRAKELGVTLKPGASGCDLLVSNLNKFEISEISSISLGEIQSTDDVTLLIAPGSDLNLELEPVLDAKRDPISSYTLLNDLSISSTSVSFTNSESKSVTINLDRSQSGSKSVALTLGTPCALDSDATVEVECDNTDSSAFTLNLDGGSAYSQYASLLFNGQYCSGVVRSIRCNDALMTPHVNVHGAVDTCDVELLLSSDSSDVAVPLRNISLDAKSEGAQLTVTENGPVVVDLAWPVNKTRSLKINMMNESDNVIRVGSGVTNVFKVNITASAESAISFASISTPITFVNSSISAINIEQEMVNLSVSSGSSFCFDSLQECLPGAWQKTLSTGQLCSSRLDQQKCLEKSRINVFQTSPVITAACGAAEWADETYDLTNTSMVLNTNGTMANFSEMSAPLIIATKGVAIGSGVLSAIGATAIFGAIVASIAKVVDSTKASGRRYVDGGKVMSWCSSMSYRDLLSDQFSWVAIVISACLAAASNVDFSQWGAPVMTVLLELRSYVLGWLDACSDNPLAWINPIVIIFWACAFVSLVLRIICGIVECHQNNDHEKIPSDCSVGVLDVFKYIQSFFTVAGLVLMPLVSYSLVYLPSESEVVGYISFCVAALMLLTCQPLGKCDRGLIVSAIFSVIVVVLPTVLSLLSGFNLTLGAIVGTGIALTVLLAFTSIWTQWSLFFKNIPVRSPSFYRSFVAVIGLRVLSMLCGIVFLSMITFTLSNTASFVAVGFWFAWIILPAFSIIPLSVMTPDAVLNTERSLYQPIGGGINGDSQDRYYSSLDKPLVDVAH